MNHFPMHCLTDIVFGSFLNLTGMPVLRSSSYFTLSQKSKEITGRKYNAQVSYVPVVNGNGIFVIAASESCSSILVFKCKSCISAIKQHSGRNPVQGSNVLTKTKNIGFIIDDGTFCTEMFGITCENTELHITSVGMYIGPH